MVGFVLVPGIVFIVVQENKYLYNFLYFVKTNKTSFLNFFSLSLIFYELRSNIKVTTLYKLSGVICLEMSNFLKY